jgi:hypothetical protein
VRDGVFDPNVMDAQLGAMTVLRRLCEMDAEVAARIDGVSPQAPKPPPDVAAARPKAAPTGRWAALVSAALSFFKRS